LNGIAGGASFRFITQVERSLEKKYCHPINRKNDKWTFSKKNIKKFFFLQPVFLQSVHSGLVAVYKNFTNFLRKWAKNKNFCSTRSV
jgi:hypothetical protein